MENQQKWKSDKNPPTKFSVSDFLLNRRNGHRFLKLCHSDYFTIPKSLMAVEFHKGPLSDHKKATTAQDTKVLKPITNVDNDPSFSCLQFCQW
ncbi:hypothetical protein K0M31_012533 [Melipona bicolor]|uniref:Uncharacterized protein n=1 Tax=Melipona bicolor TaxID=60889 RepID=A0AA40FJR9_9HYME|nr:hypothetical protein K0M31_012533 [Melipona bicolor]